MAARATIRFLLGHEPRSLSGLDPTMTVLDYLRRVERRCGSKEGCAEGDCGACTVVLGELNGQGPEAGLRYHAVNACIVFLPMLDGKQLLSVEDLKRPDGALHPVQQAMVETHASQCGYCTPGFVMTLFALYRAGTRPTRAGINDALAGNLCRCTGYGPIVAAAERALEQAPRDHMAKGEAAVIAQLQAWRDDDTMLAFELAGRRCFAPRSSDALAELVIEHPDAVLVAGATDVGLWVTKLHRSLQTVILLGGVAELRRIETRDEAIEIGAGVTYGEAAPILAHPFPDMGELFRRFGGWQVRNLATVGGNVANGSPVGDGPPALIAAGAELVLRRGQERRTLHLEDFFLAYGKQDRRPGEFVETIVVPLPRAGDRFGCYKLSKRFDQDISAVCGAFRLRREGGRVADIRIAFGGMAATPKRAAAAEAALVGAPWSEVSVRRAMTALAGDFQPISDLRAGRDYRALAAGNLLYRFFLETGDSGVATRLAGVAERAHA